MAVQGTDPLMAVLVAAEDREKSCVEAERRQEPACPRVSFYRNLKKCLGCRGRATSLGAEL